MKGQRPTSTGFSACNETYGDDRKNRYARALYDAVYRAAGLSRAEAAALVELVLEEIASCLERGEAVKLSAFGSFIVRQKSQRMGRNPKTGKVAPIPPGLGVVFKPSAVLRQRINLRS